MESPTITTSIVALVVEPATVAPLPPRLSVACHPLPLRKGEHHGTHTTVQVAIPIGLCGLREVNAFCADQKDSGTLFLSPTYASCIIVLRLVRQLVSSNEGNAIKAVGSRLRSPQ